MGGTKKSKIWAARLLTVLFAAISVLLIAMKYNGVLFPVRSNYIDGGINRGFEKAQSADHGNIEQIIQDYSH